jgi:tetratricopeptide (TPR) repeat protein
MRYKGTDKRLSEIANELNVDAVVEGSALRVDGSVRIMAQLIDPLTEQALWADSYEQDLQNVLLLWSEVAQAIAGAVQVALTPEDTERLATARPVNPEAHDAYLKGSYHSDRLTREDLDTAEGYFNLALEKDPSYAPAYVGLSGVWGKRAQMGYAPPHEAQPKAIALAQQAIALDDSSARTHSRLASIKTWAEWDWAGAEPEWRRALEIDPNAAGAHRSFAHFLAITGRIDEAIPHSERALELDPFNAMHHGFYAVVLEGARRYDDAIAAARTALSMQPNMPVAAGAMQCALLSLGKREEHLDFQRSWFADDPELVGALEQGLADAGYEGAMRRVGDILAARYEKSGGVSAPGTVPHHPWAILYQYLYAGDYDLAMDWLEKAFEVRDPNQPYIALCPTFDPVRSDPRFQDLLRRMNLPTTSARSDPDEQR